MDLQTVIFDYDISYFARVLTRCRPLASIEKLAGVLIDAQSTLASVASMPCCAPTFTKNPDSSLQFEGINNRDWL